MRTVNIKRDELVKNSTNVIILNPNAKLAPNEAVMDMVYNEVTDMWEFPGFHAPKQFSGVNVIHGTI